MPSMFTLFFLILYSSLCPPSFLIATCVRLPCSPPSSVVPSLLKVEPPPHPPPSLEFQLRGFKVSGSVVGGVGRVGGGSSNMPGASGLRGLSRPTAERSWSADKPLAPP